MFLISQYTKTLRLKQFLLQLKTTIKNHTNPLVFNLANESIPDNSSRRLKLQWFRDLLNPDIIH